jgi:hypothetical protein
MKRFALVFLAILAAAPSSAAPQDPMDELSGDPNSPQRHLIPPGAHEPLIEESDGTILVSYVTEMPKEKIEAFLAAELKKEGWRIASNMEAGPSIIYLLEGPDPVGGSITLTRENGRIRILVSLG